MVISLNSFESLPVYCMINSIDHDSGAMKHTELVEVCPKCILQPVQDAEASKTVIY
jgi:hypothetical protein